MRFLNVRYNLYHISSKYQSYILKLAKKCYFCLNLFYQPGATWKFDSSICLFRFSLVGNISLVQVGGPLPPSAFALELGPAWWIRKIKWTWNMNFKLLPWYTVKIWGLNSIGKDGKLMILWPFISIWTLNSLW